MEFLKITASEFGENNENFTVEFDRKTGHSSNKSVAEAIRVMFDIGYLNEKVTKPDYLGDDSFLELTFEFCGEQHTIKQKFGRNYDLFLDGRVARGFELETFRIKIPEPYYTTPSRLLDHVMKHVFVLQQKLENQAEHLKSNSIRKLREFDEMVTVPELRAFDDAIKNDLTLNENIQKLFWKWKCSKKNPEKNDHQRKMMDNAPEQPTETIDFSDTSVNVFMASLQSKIVAHQEEICSRLIKKIENDSVAYKPNEQMLRTAAWDKLMIDDAVILKRKEYAKNNLDFHTAYPHVASLYKKRFSTAQAWEDDKKEIRKRIAEEIAFAGQLERGESEQKDIAIALQQQIDEKISRVEELTDDLKAYNRSINKLTVSVFSAIQSYILDTVLSTISDFSDVLVNALNHPLLERADMKNYIAGMVYHHLSGCYGDQQPDFLFSNIATHKEYLSKHLQPYLAPSLKIQFADSREEVRACIDALATSIDLQPAENRYETTFVFSAHPFIDEKQPSTMRPLLLSNIPKNVGYGQNFDRLLSNFGITSNENDRGQRGSNFLNLSTKAITFANGMQTTVTEASELFELLQSIQDMYAKIGQIINGFDDVYGPMIREVNSLMRILGQYYEIESQLRVELSNLQQLAFEEFLAIHTRNGINELQLECKTRLLIDRYLLTLQFDDPVNEEGIYEILSQQNADVSELSVVVGVDNVATALNMPLSPHANKVKALFENVCGRNTRISIKDEMLSILEVWKNVSKDMFVESSDALQQKLSEISGMDKSHRWYCSSHLEVPQGYRRANNETGINIFRQADTSFIRLQYPLCSPETLKMVAAKVKRLEKPGSVLNCVISMTERIMQMHSSDSLMEVLCDELSSFMRRPDIKFSCEVGEYQSDRRIQWRQNMFPTARFSASDNNFFLNPRNFHFFSVLVYVVCIRLFTWQPILLHRVLEGCDTLFITELWKLIRNVGDRSSVFQIDQTTADRLDVLAQELFQTPQVEQSAEAVDEGNVEGREDFDMNARERDQNPQVSQSGEDVDVDLTPTVSGLQELFQTPQVEQSAEAVDEGNVEGRVELDINARERDQNPQVSQSGEDVDMVEAPTVSGLQELFQTPQVEQSAKAVDEGNVEGREDFDINARERDQDPQVSQSGEDVDMVEAPTVPGRQESCQNIIDSLGAQNATVSQELSTQRRDRDQNVPRTGLLNIFGALDELLADDSEFDPELSP